jgi:hypothetical protein
MADINLNNTCSINVIPHAFRANKAYKQVHDRVLLEAISKEAIKQSLSVNITPKCLKLK